MSIRRFPIAGGSGGGTSYTDEQARDAVAAALVEGANIDITVDDAGDTITVAVAGLATVSTTTQPASYTLALVDAGTAVEFTSATAVSATIPPSSTVAFPVGTVIELVQYGAGQVTVAAGAGVTIRTAGSLATRAQYSALSLRKRGVDEWILSGDTA